MGVSRTIDENSVLVKSRKYGEMVTSCDNCDCSFHKSMLLPCGHIFAVMNHIGKPLFGPDVCSRRWSKEHFKKSHRIFQTVTPSQDLQDAGTSAAVMNEADVEGVFEDLANTEQTALTEH